jgi:hypothetical protein
MAYYNSSHSVEGHGGSDGGINLYSSWHQRSSESRLDRVVEVEDPVDGERTVSEAVELSSSRREDYSEPPKLDAGTGKLVEGIVGEIPDEEPQLNTGYSGEEVKEPVHDIDQTQGSSPSDSAGSEPVFTLFFPSRLRPEKRCVGKLIALVPLTP